MERWVKVCLRAEAPEAGKAGQYSADGVDVCLANVDGELFALDNLCPHRAGPLGEGWIEGNAVICPWHAWAFDVKTGECPEERSHVTTFPVKRDSDDVLVNIG